MRKNILCASTQEGNISKMQNSNGDISLCGKKLNKSYIGQLLKTSFVTAVGYTAWHIYTVNANPNWSKKKSTIGLFLVVLLALIVANIVFTFIFQKNSFWESGCGDNSAGKNPPQILLS